MVEPKISVIVPVYNTDRYTGFCIESIINQSYRNLEIILVDDGSSDRCPELCDLYASKDSRINVIHKQNGGLVSARKKGMEASSGEYITYVDGDDWIEKNHFKIISDEIIQTDADVIISDWTRALFDQHVVIHNNVGKGLYHGEGLKQLKTQLISMHTFYRPSISTYVWNKAFKRDIVYDCQMNVDNRLMTGEDSCVSYAAILKSNSVSVINNASYYYRQHEDSMLKRKSNYEAEIERMRILYENMMQFAGDDNNLKKQVDDYVLSSCIIRTGGLNPEFQGYIFGPDFEGKRVVVYGAGSFGQLFMSRLIERGDCTISGWIDDDYWEYRRSCLDVDPVETIIGCLFDYVIIASVDGEVGMERSARLKKMGISPDKIVNMNIPEDIRHELLLAYLK